ncbi:MAG: type II secretion system protein [Halioglobus sp.]
MKRTAFPNAKKSAAGFSLLEMVVALAIMGISLSALYQAIGGATRTVTVDEKMAYAVELARSLVADHAVVPSGGVQKNGGTQSGFEWSVVALPVDFPDDSLFPEGMLQTLAVSVRWPDGEKERAFELNSVVAGSEEAE